MNKGRIAPREFVTQLQSTASVLHNDLRVEFDLLSAKNTDEMVKFARRRSSTQRNQGFLNYLSKRGVDVSPDERGNDPHIILVSHQPTLFAYSGVYVQFILASQLAGELRKLGEKAIVVWLALDLDDCYDRRIRNTHLQNYYGRLGTTAIQYPIEKSLKNTAQSKVKHQGEGLLSEWSRLIGNYFEASAASFPNNRDTIGQLDQRMRTNLNDLFRSASTQKPHSFSQFSAYMTKRFVGKLGIEDIHLLFFSDLLSEISSVLEHLIETWPVIREQSAEVINLFAKNAIDVQSMAGMLREPIWLICKGCGFRNQAQSETGYGNYGLQGGISRCKRCDTGLTESVRSPRVLLEDLATTLFCDPSITLTYAGSASHVLLSSLILQRQFGVRSPLFTWHPKHILNGSLFLPYFRSKAGPSEDAMRQIFIRNLGRDSMLMAPDAGELGALTTLWIEHFQRSKLHETVVSSMGEEVVDLIGLS